MGKVIVHGKINAYLFINYYFINLEAAVQAMQFTPSPPMSVSTHLTNPGAEWLPRTAGEV